MLKDGIPKFRLPSSVVDAEIGKLIKLGMKFECNSAQATPAGPEPTMTLQPADCHRRKRHRDSSR